MNKPRIGLYFITSLTIGLLLSACAGYAVDQFTREPSSLTSGPTFQSWSLSNLMVVAGPRIETHQGGRPQTLAVYAALEQTHSSTFEYGGICGRP
jgi:hypothetical protein